MTKLAAEHLCVLYGEEHDVDTVALRYFSVYGPRQRPDMAFRRFCEAITAGEPIEVFGDGRQTRDFTYVADIVAATRAAGEADTPPGPRVQHRRREPHEPALRAGDAGGARRAPARRALRRARVRATCSDTGADTRRARAELGFDPRTTPGGGARRGAGLGARARRARAAGEKLDRFLTFTRTPA